MSASVCHRGPAGCCTFEAARQQSFSVTDLMMLCKGGNAFQPGAYPSGRDKGMDCTCPDGQVYEIGGPNESGALALCAAAGGTPVAGTYRYFKGQWSGNLLICVTPSKMSTATIQDCAIANSSSQAKTLVASLVLGLQSPRIGRGMPVLHTFQTLASSTSQRATSPTATAESFMAARPRL